MLSFAKNKILFPLDLHVGRKLAAVDQTASRLLKGLINHILVKLRQHNFVQGKPDCDSSEIRRNGFTTVNSAYLEPGLVNQIKNEVGACFEDKALVSPRGALGSNGEYYSFRIDNVAERVPSTAKILTPGIIETIKEYYGCNFEVAAVNIWRNYSIPLDELRKKEVFSENWHWDHRQSTMLKLFYLVDDVDQTKGPFHFQDKNRSKAIIRAGYKSRTSPSLNAIDINDPNHVQQFTGSAGRIAIINTTQCIHKAGIPAEGSYRDIIQFQFFPSREPLRSDWLSHTLNRGLSRKGK